MRKINRISGMLMVLSLVLLAAPEGQAFTASFLDNYQGGNTPGSYTDVVGKTAVFDLSSLRYTTDGTHHTVQIVGNYFNTTGNRLGTLLGDLFISVDGWQPYGAAPHTTDTRLNGEDWELAAVLDKHDFKTTSGNLKLYSVLGNNIVSSYYDVAGPCYNNSACFRSDQEVQYSGQGFWEAEGTWQITGNTLTLDFDYAALGVHPDLGFHWAMTCGNDVIEGGIHVPEPGTMMLLGTGLAGMGFAVRRRRK